MLIELPRRVDLNSNSKKKSPSCKTRLSDKMAAATAVNYGDPSSALVRKTKILIFQKMYLQIPKIQLIARAGLLPSLLSY